MTLRRLLPVLALACAVAACQATPPAAPTGGEGQLSAGRSGRAKVAVGGKELALRTADGKPLTGLAVQIGGKSYPVKDGKLALPADAFARAKAEGGLVVLAPGYVPRRVALDAAAEVALAPIGGDGGAQLLAGAGGEAGTGAFAVRLEPGRLARPAAVTVSSYEPADATPAAAGELERLKRAITKAGGRAPAACGDTLPCPPLAGALGVLVAIDGPLTPGPLPVTIDLDALGADRARVADRLIATLAAIEARSDAAAWRAALAAEFGLSWEGHGLTIAVPIGEEARTSGTTRIDVAGAALLGATVEVTVVSAVEGSLPAEARPPGMPAAPAGPAPAATASLGAARALRGGSNMGADGGVLLTVGRPFAGGPGATLIGMDGATLIGMDGATLIGMDGATLVGRDGVGLISDDGSTLISDDGSTLIGNDGGSLIGNDGGSLIGNDGGSLISDDGSTLIGQDGATLVGPDGATLIANNAGGALAGHVRVPFRPDAAKYRLQAYTDYEWPAARVWVMDGYGRPYANAVATDDTGAFRVEGLGATLSGVIVAVAAGPSTLYALAKAPGAGTRDVLVDAATTGATAVYLTEQLRAPAMMRPVDQTRYLALAGALRAAMGQGDAEKAVKGPIAEVARNVKAFCAANGIPVDLTGTVSTFAGVPSGLNGVFAPGPASGVRFNGPADVIHDAPNNRMLIADMYGNGVRAVDLATGQATTVGGPISRVRAFARHPDGRLLAASVGFNEVVAITGGAPASVAGSTSGYLDGPAASARFQWPTALAANAAGDVFVGDPLNNCIRKVAAGTGVVSTYAGVKGAIGAADGPLAGARFWGPDALAFGPEGDLFVADRDNHCIRKITPAGVVSTVAGAPGVAGRVDGFGRNARFFFPRGLAVDAAGHLWVSDSGNGLIRRVARSGLVTTYAGGRPRLPTETIAHADGPAASTLFSDNHGICFGPGGDLFVADQSNHCVRRIRF